MQAQSQPKTQKNIEAKIALFQRVDYNTVMQYKIPVQIENEDTIFLNLSLRQLGIILVGGWIGYSIFKSLEPAVGSEIAIIPMLIILVIFIGIALFKNSEMTFLPFILNLIRLNLSAGNRLWNKGTESYSNIMIGYVTSYSNIQEKTINKGSFNEVENDLSDHLSKI